MAIIRRQPSLTYDEIRGNLINIITLYLDSHDDDPTSTIDQCFAMIAFRSPYSFALVVIFRAALELAAWHKYSRYSSDKLANLVVTLISSRPCHDQGSKSVDGRMVTQHVLLGAWHVCLQKFGISADRRGYVNQRAINFKVESGLCASGLVLEVDIRPLGQAFDGGPQQVGYVAAASLLILYHGPCIYRAASKICHCNDDELACVLKCKTTARNTDVWDRILTCLDAVSISNRTNRSHHRLVWVRLCINRWQHWRQSLMDAAIGRCERPDAPRRSQECRTLALKAVRKMIDIEDGTPTTCACPKPETE